MKRALQYIEIDVDHCALTYGVAPCTASIPTTGAIKCFNSPGTCQDRPHFSNAPVTLRFAVPTSYLPAEIDCDPCIKEPIQFDPATLSLGENLGTRATLTVNLVDHPDSDTGPAGDKYRADRAYGDAFSQGSFFGKFRARQPFVRGRALRWITGFVGDALADMTARHFIIDSFNGPTPAGVYTLVAKDVLKLADGDRAMAPRPSTGYLVADIDASVTAGHLALPGVGDAEYPASGYVAIGGSEICGFTRSGDNLTISRGQLGTAATTHKAQDRVQVVLRYTAADVANIIADLLENYADIPSSYIPIADWLVETGAFLSTVYSATIANPTSVNQLLAELVEQAALAIWQRDSDLTIGLQVLRGIDTSALEFTGEQYMTDTLSLQEQPDKRISQVVTYFSQVNPLTSLTDVANFRSMATATDSQAEADYGSPAIKTIYSRWIPTGGRAVADLLNQLQLSRFRDPPRKFGFSILRDSIDVVPALGQGFRLKGWPIQGATGAPTSAPIEVTRVNPGHDVIAVTAEEMLYTPPVDQPRRVIYDFDIYNVNLRAAHDSLYSPIQSGDTVLCTILAGVVIGSGFYGSPAFDVGTWPAGVTIILENLGTIAGRGGDGGVGGSGGVGGPGTPGGAGLKTTVAISLKNSAGRIQGGGGGGGGGGASVIPSLGQSAGGGGGGAGAGQRASLAGGPGGSGRINGGTGAAASLDAGGGGGLGGNDGTFAGPGGGGGDPGAIGQFGVNGQTGGLVIGLGGGPPGAPGVSIDGLGHVTFIGAHGDIRG